MDLQSYVEQRIRELETGGAENRQDQRWRSGDDLTLDSGSSGRRPVASRSRAGRFAPDTSLDDFIKMVDAALVEIAARVMEIADSVSENNARWEREMMDAGLSALESAESVMDMALDIRKKAHSFQAGGTRAARGGQHLPGRGFTGNCEIVDSSEPGAPGDGSAERGARASMHEVGVAALFRNTR